MHQAKNNLVYAPLIEHKSYQIPQFLSTFWCCMLFSSWGNELSF